MQTQELVKVNPTVVDGIKFFVSPDGSEVGISLTGLAKLAGVEYSSVQTVLGLHRSSNYKVSTWLKHLEGGIISSKIEGYGNVKAVTPQAAAEVITHYAYESKAANDVARRSLQQFTALGMDNWMRSQIKKVTASKEALVAHLNGVFQNSPDSAAKANEVAEAVEKEILDAVKELKKELEELQASVRQTNEQQETRQQQYLNKVLDATATAKPDQKQKYCKVSEYLSKKGVVMSRQELVQFSYLVAATYRAVIKKEPKKIQSRFGNGVNVYSTAELPILDMALAKHLGL